MKVTRLLCVLIAHKERADDSNGDDTCDTLIGHIRNDTNAIQLEKRNHKSQTNEEKLEKEEGILLITH